MGLLFKYSLNDARSLTLSEIAIFESEPGYVSSFVQGNNDFTLPREQKRIDLDSATFDKIRGLISEIKVTELEFLEHVLVLDGYAQEFSYKVDGREANFVGFNLRYCKDQPALYPNAMVMIRLLQKLKNILVPLGVDKKCFSLSR